jgi:hypothetical protein
MTNLRTQEGFAARALEFLILTAARTGEVIGARWEEFGAVPPHRGFRLHRQLGADSGRSRDPD